MSRPSDVDEGLWGAVADPSRRLLLDVLLAEGEATQTRLAEQLPYTRQAVSKHLAVLDRAGLVDIRKQGREIYFRVRPERLDDAVRAMAATARQWEVRLRAIKRLAEQRER